MNLQRSQAILQFCLKHGVREVVICAGARNAPLIDLVGMVQGLRTWSFFDERAAAFFALGRIEQSGLPVAVLTTSGTAVAELLPACIEAFYQGRPLVLITADRPSRFRGTGSPQTIEQSRLFGPMVEHSLDLEDTEDVLQNCEWSLRRPLHLNVCLEEPQSHRPRAHDLQAAARFCEDSLAEGAKVRPRLWPNGFENLPLKGSYGRPLVILGPVSRMWRDHVREFLGTLAAPVYAESVSGLTGDSRLQGRLIFSEEVAQSLLEKGVCQSVIRVGTVPTLRLWRDLEEKMQEVPVLNLVPPEAIWSGLARTNGVETRAFTKEKSSLVQAHLDQDFCLPMSWLETSRRGAHFFQELARRFPSAEPSLMEALSRASTACRVYVGNSLPIREWDWVSPGRGYRDIYANRGANGIDGQLDTSLGWSIDEHAPSLTLVGDLTALYGLSSLAASSQLTSGSRHIVVMNNGGGMIFRKIFPEPSFLNAHQLSFSGWAQMFGWSYRCWTHRDEIPLTLEEESWVTELRPVAAETEAFHREWRSWVEREVSK